MPEPASDIAANLARLQKRVGHAAERAGRAADEITLVAVSKTFPVEAIRTAYLAGVRHFGENRVQEMDEKHSKLADLDATWHFIGHLQSNKARLAAERFDRIDSVDSLALARKLEVAATETEQSLPVLIEVHLGEEATKSGVTERDLQPLAEQVSGLGHLSLCGLMAVPPFYDNPQHVRPYFRRLRELRDGLSRHLGHPLPTVSMGMSHDFEIAIEEGATEIRVGTALFGPRPQKAG